MVVRNDLENLPFGLILLWASALCIVYTQVGPLGGFSETLKIIKTHIAFSIIFCVVRYAHTVVYVLGVLRPLRTVLWFIGVFSTLGLGIVGAVSAFRSEFNNFY